MFKEFFSALDRIMPSSSIVEKCIKAALDSEEEKAASGSNNQ